LTLPPCFNLLNVAYFESVISQINSAETLGELQTIIDSIYGEIGLLESTIDGQLAFLGPIEALLTPPINPVAAVTWIENFITGFLTPYFAPFVKFTAQLAALAAQTAAIGAAAEAAAARLEGSIVIPTITVPFCTL
jgi:hypothetical protein